MDANDYRIEGLTATDASCRGCNRSRTAIGRRWTRSSRRRASELERAYANAADELNRSNTDARQEAVLQG